jgi:hypothetical protein
MERVPELSSVYVNEVGEVPRVPHETQQAVFELLAPCACCHTDGFDIVRVHLSVADDAHLRNGGQLCARELQ